MPALHTLLDFTLTALCAPSGRKYDQETEISILYSVALSGIDISIGLEYSQTCSFNRLLTYLSFIFPERFYPGFHLFTFESPLTTQLHLTILAVNWLLGKTIFYCSQRRSLWENLHSHGIIDQTGRWGLAYRETDSYYLQKCSQWYCRKLKDTEGNCWLAGVLSVDVNALCAVPLVCWLSSLLLSWCLFRALHRNWKSPGNLVFLYTVESSQIRSISLCASERCRKA